ncbi:MAG: viroplasmin family protein [Cetobacterium sp.]
MAQKYYAFHLTKGNIKGIVNNWNECKEIVNGVSCKYMSFKSECDAQEWLDNQGSFIKRTLDKSELEHGIYFDAGKRGKNAYTRVRVADRVGGDLLHKLSGGSIETVKKAFFNGSNVNIDFNNARILSRRYTGKPVFTLNNYNGKVCVQLGVDQTNNVGELMGFILACEIASSEEYLGPKKIFGDSKLILDYWSKGVYNKKNVSSVEVDTIMHAIELRKKLEQNGFSFEFVSGDVNPADLGDHK